MIGRTCSGVGAGSQPEQRFGPRSGRLLTGVVLAGVCRPCDPAQGASGLPLEPLVTTLRTGPPRCRCSIRKAFASPLGRPAVGLQREGRQFGNVQFEVGHPRHPCSFHCQPKCSSGAGGEGPRRGGSGEVSSSGGCTETEKTPPELRVGNSCILVMFTESGEFFTAGSISRGLTFPV